MSCAWPSTKLSDTHVDIVSMRGSTDDNDIAAWLWRPRL